jgi:TetR/AcrR family transcriptional regulator, regulator of biofilm formation and stress response
VVADRGIGALTHRAVAEQADVSLSSTTYYFVDRADLIRAALERAVSDYEGELEEWAEQLQAGRFDLVQGLTDRVIDSRGVDRDLSAVGYELIIAARRHPDLHPLGVHWDGLLPNLLRQFVDPDASEMLAFAIEGFSSRGLIQEALPERGFVEDFLRRIVEQDDG